MDATVIDTLRYANRLREAGVEAGQAEAMARAINDELSVGVATRDDVGAVGRNMGHALAEFRSKMDHSLAEFRAETDHSLAEFRAETDHSLAELRSDMEHGFAKLRGEMDHDFAKLRGEMDHGFAKLRGEMDHGLTEVRGDMDALRAEVTAKLDAQNGKFEAQGRYLFLTLAVIAALGLYNAAAPHFTGNTNAAVRSGDPPPTAPASAGKTRPAPQLAKD